MIRRIKQDKDLHTIPVVVLTSSAAGNDITTSYDCLANSYNVKPIDRLQFNQLMVDIGFYWLE